MVKTAAAARTTELDPIDRLEEKVRRLVQMIAQLRAEQARAAGAEAWIAFGGLRDAGDVRDAENVWRAKGINAVPAVIINGRYLISGGQPPELFEQAIRKVVAESAEVSATA